MNRSDFFRGVWLSPLALVRGPETPPDAATTIDAQPDPALAQVLGTTGDVLNVKAFGATGDGTTNDVGAIQAAIDSANTSGGGIVFVPAGTYIIASKLVMKSNVALVGIGPASSIKGVFSSGRQALMDNDWVNGSENCSLRNIQFDRTGANAQHGLLFNKLTNFLADGLSIVGTSSVTSGALAISGIGPRTDLLSENLRIVNCYFEGADNFGIQLGFVLNAVVANCQFKDCFREVIGVEPEGAGQSAENVSIIGNQITTPSTGGGTFTGVIVVTETSGGTIKDVSIVGNTIQNTTIIASNLQPGIMVLGAASVIVSGNTVRDANGVGIQLGSAGQGPTDCIVSGNTIINSNAGNNPRTEDVGIRLRDATDCQVSNNRVSGANVAIGIEEQLGANRNRVFNNVLIGCTAGVTLIGAGSVEYNNIVTSGESDLSTSTSNLVAVAFRNSRIATLGNAATPSVLGDQVFKTGNTTTVTDFDDGVVGQEIVILAEHRKTITDNGAIILAGGANYAMNRGDTLTLRMFNDQIWHEVARSVT